MGKKLYVGSLPFSTTREELMKLFSEVGQVEDVNLITDKFSGRSKGFAFVEMASEEDAKKAIEQLNGKELDGRTIRVDEAQPPKKRDFNRN